MGILERYLQMQIDSGRFGLDTNVGHIVGAIRRFRSLYPHVKDGSAHYKEREGCLKTCDYPECRAQGQCIGESTLVNEGNRIYFVLGDTREQFTERNIFLRSVLRALGRNKR